MADDSDPLLDAASAAGWKPPQQEQDDPLVSAAKNSGWKGPAEQQEDPLLSAAKASGWKPPEKSTPLGAFGHSVERGIIPAAAGYGGAALGAATGAELGAFGGPLAWATVPAGAIIGGLVGGLGAGYGASKLQESGLGLLPEEAQKAIGQDPETRAAEEKEHPNWAYAGEVAPNIAFLRPSLSTPAVPSTAGRIAQVAGSPLGSRAISATTMGGLEAGQELAHGEDLSPGKIAISTGLGAISNKPSELGEAIHEPIQTGVAKGAQALSNVTGIKAPTPPVPPGLSKGQRRDFTPPEFEDVPDGAPSPGTVVGYRTHPDAEPERYTILGYIDKGRAVAVLPEGVTNPADAKYIASQALMGNLAAPPEAEDSTRGSQPRRIEGTPIEEADIDKAFPLDEGVDTAAIRARAAGSTPDAVRRADREQQNRLATGTIPGMGENLSALDMANRAERQAMYLLQAGRTDEAQTQMAVAQRWRDLHGAGPGEYIGPEGEEVARQAREAAVPQQQVLGQPAKPINRQPLTAEEAADMEADARAARQAAIPVEKPEVLGQKTEALPRQGVSADEAAAMEEQARVAREAAVPPQGETELMGQRVGAAPGRGPDLTPDEVEFLRSIQPQRKSGQGRMELTGEAQSGGFEITPEMEAQLAERRAAQAAARQAAQAKPQASFTMNEQPAVDENGNAVAATSDQPQPARQPRQTGQGGVGGRPKTYPALEDVPAEPQRLIDWIRANGGVKDVGGDLQRGMGGNGAARFKGTIINNKTGMSLDDAATAAQEMGFLPEAFSATSTDRANSSVITRAGGDTAPDLINPLIEAITEDYNGKPRYSENDRADVDAYRDALAANNDIEENASRYGIDLKGKTREQFYNELQQKVDAEERAALEDEESRHLEDGLQQAHEEYPEFFEYEGTPRSLEDLEREYGQEEPPGELVSREQGAERTEPAARGAEPVQEDTGQVELSNRPGERPEERDIDQTDQGAQRVLPGAERATDEEVEAQKTARTQAEDQLRAKTFRLEIPKGDTSEVYDILGSEDRYHPEKRFNSIPTEEGGFISPIAQALAERQLEIAARLDAQGWTYSEENGWVSPKGKQDTRYDYIPGLEEAKANQDRIDQARSRVEDISKGQPGEPGENLSPMDQAKQRYVDAKRSLDAYERALDKGNVRPLEYYPAKKEFDAASRDLTNLERQQRGQEQLPATTTDVTETTPAPREKHQYRLLEGQAEPDEVPLSDQELRDMGMEPPKEYADHTDRFHDWFAQQGYGDTPQGHMQAAQDWVTTRGNTNGSEYSVIYDPETGRVVHAGTNDAWDWVGIPDEFTNEPGNFTINHNHLWGRSLSAPDLAATMTPGVGKAVAYGPHGEVFSASATPEAKEWAASRANFGDEVSDIYDAANRVIKMSLKAQGDRIHPDDFMAIASTLVNRALDRAGLIDYMGTVGLYPLSDKVVESITRRAAEAAAGTARKFDLTLQSGKDLDASAHQSSVVFRPDEVMESLSRGHGEAEGAGERPGGEVYPGSDAGTQGAGRGEAPVVDRNATGVTRLAESRDEDNAERGGVRPEVSRPQGQSRPQEGAGLNPERKPYVPEGTDYLDNVSHQMAAQAQKEGAGTYARSENLANRGVAGEQGYRLNFINKYFTTPMTLARLDSRSGVKWNAEEALRNEASGLRQSYRDLLPTFLTATPEELRQVNQVREWRRLKGEVAPTDGRASMIFNDGSVPAALSEPGDRVYLDDPRTIKIDQELTQAFQKAWTDVTAATAKKFGWQGEPTSAALKEAIAQATSTRDKRDLQRTFALVSAMEDIRRSGYTPLMRYGDYYFAITPKAGTEAAKNMGWEGGKDYGFAPVANFQLMDSLTPWEKAKGGKFIEGQTPPEAQKRLDILKQQFPEDQWNIEHGQFWAKENVLRDLNIPAIEKLFTIVGNDIKRKISENARNSQDPEAAKKADQQTKDMFDRVKGGVLDQLYKDIMAGQKKQSQNTPGYDTDFTRSSAIYLNWAANHVANLLHKDDIDRIDQNIIAKHPNDNVREYWEKYNDAKEQDDGLLGVGLRKARQAAFYWALGANAATTLKIMLHGPLLGVPTLGTGLGGLGRAKAAMSYVKAIDDAYSGVRFDTQNGLNINWRNIPGLTDGEKAMLGKLESEGRLHAQNTDDMRSIQRAGEDAFTPQAKFNRRVLNVIASNVSMADQAIRTGMALAAYRLAQNPTHLDNMSRVWGGDNLFKQMQDSKGNVSPEDMARFMVDRTVGVQGDQNRMPVARNLVGRQLLQFRGYETNYLSTMKQLWGMGPEGKTSVLLMMGGLFGLAGAGAVPFAKDIGNLINWIAPGDMEDAQKALGMDNTTAETIMHGMTRNVLGFDLGQGIGFGDLISRQAESGLNLAGPAASILFGGAYRAWQRANNGQPVSAYLDEVMPNAVKGAVKAWLVEPQQGVTAAKTGHRIMTPEQITPGMQIAQTFGLQPTALNKEYEKESEVYGQRMSHNNAVGSIENRMSTLGTQAIELRKTDPVAAQKLFQQIQDELNAAEKSGKLYPEDNKRIMSSIHNRIKANQNPDIGTVKSLPKSQRGPWLEQHPLQPQQ